MALTTVDLMAVLLAGHYWSSTGCVGTGAPAHIAKGSWKRETEWARSGQGVGREGALSHCRTTDSVDCPAVRRQGAAASRGMQTMLAIL